MIGMVFAIKYNVPYRIIILSSGVETKGSFRFSHKRHLITNCSLLAISIIIL